MTAYECPSCGKLCYTALTTSKPICPYCGSPTEVLNVDDVFVEGTTANESAS